MDGPIQAPFHVSFSIKVTHFICGFVGAVNDAIKYRESFGGSDRMVWITNILILGGINDLINLRKKSIF